MQLPACRLVLRSLYWCKYPVPGDVTLHQANYKLVCVCVCMCLCVCVHVCVCVCVIESALRVLASRGRTITNSRAPSFLSSLTPFRLSASCLRGRIIIVFSVSFSAILIIPAQNTTETPPRARLCLRMNWGWRAYCCGLDWREGNGQVDTKRHPISAVEEDSFIELTHQVEVVLALKTSDTFYVADGALRSVNEARP